MSTEQFSEDRIAWNDFCSVRLHYLKSLAETVEQGFIRRDTSHPAFCGCIDWHSSVHGAYALLTAARLTGEIRWARVVDNALGAACLASELASLQRGELNHELPYGYAWFLKLAQEREQGWDKTDLRFLATEIATRLGQWMGSLSDAAVIHHTQRPEYGNLSWPLLNLWQWGIWNQNSNLLDQLSNFTRSRFWPLNPECSVFLDHPSEEFFLAALQQCRTLLTILSPEDSSTWLDSHQYEDGTLLPLTTFPTIHSAGLNFSRSWGLWTLYRHTKNPAFRDLYANHIVTHLEMPQYWRDDYRKHGHWVPQFGIYAIALSMDDVN